MAEKVDTNNSGTVRDNESVRELGLLRERVSDLCREVEKSRKTEENLRVSLANYHAIYDAVNDAIFVHDVDTLKIIDVNQKMCEMFGFTTEEARQLELKDLCLADPPFTVENLIQRMHMAIRGKPQIFEWRTKDSTGRLFWVEVSLRSASIRGDRRLLSVVRDITFRKGAEEALKESERKLATLLSNLRGMAYRCKNDRAWAIEFVSEGCVDLTGYKSAELMNGRNITYGDIIHEDDREYVWNTVQNAIAKGDAFQLEYRITTATGEGKWVWERGRSVVSDTGEVMGLEGFITDITNLHRTEEALRIASRQEATASLAGDVALDLNDLMTDLSRNAELLLSKCADFPDVSDELSAVHASVERAKELARHLLALGHAQRRPKDRIDLNQIIRTTIASLRRELPPGNVINEKLRSRLWSIRGDASQIAQAVDYLLTNAVEAIGAEGVITVATRNLMVDGDAPPPHSQLKTGSHVCMTVSDTGCGMDSDTLSKIFEPFFSTQANGMRLSLAAVYSIVQNHNGYIAVDSTEGKGSTFKVYFPAGTETKKKKPQTKKSSS